METRLEASLLKSRIGRLSSKRLLSVYNKVTKVSSEIDCTHLQSSFVCT